MVDSSGLGQTQAQIADVVNQKYKGYSQKQRNQMMQSGTTDPGAFSMQYQPEIQQAQQPSEFWGAGRKEASGITDPTIAASLGFGTQNLGGQNYYYGDLDPSTAQWGTAGYQTQDLGKGKYDILNSSGGSIGTGYKSVADTIKELGGSNYNPNAQGGLLADWEALGQMLQNGSTASRGQWGSLPTNSATESVQGLNTLFGSTPLIGGNKVLGYKLDLAPGNSQSYQNGDDTLKADPFGYSMVHNGKNQSWASGLERVLNNPNAWAKDGKILNSGYDYYTPTQNAEKLPGWTNYDSYARQKHPQGMLSEVFNVLDPLIDSIDPLHNEVQTWITGHSDTAGQSPYFQTIMPAILNTFFPGVGSAVSAVDSGTKGDWSGAATNALASYFGASGGIDTGYGSAANAAATSAATSGAQSLASGKSLDQAFMNALLGAAGSYAGGAVGDATKSLGTGLSGFLSGATSGAVNGLSNSNHLLESALTSGIGGGLGGMFNSKVNPADTKQINQNKQMGQNLAKLSGIFAKGK